MSRSVSVTWWGHATTTIELAGSRVLTDPVLTRRVAHLSRIGGPMPAPDALRADVVVVSHLHLDHLHLPSLRRLAAGVRIIAPLGAARVLRRWAPDLARRTDEVGPGDVVDLRRLRVQAVRAVHDGRRSPVSRQRGPALGFILQGDDARPDRVWFAGDTGLFAGMSDFAPVDVAVIPVGGWGPSLGPTHLDPVQAAEAVRRVGATDAVPIHYATFWPTGLRHLHPPSFRRSFADPGARFAAALASGPGPATAHVLLPGETARIPGPGR